MDLIAHKRDLARLSINAIYARRQFRVSWRTLIKAVDREARVGEPDRAIRFDDDIVRRIETSALIAVCEYRNRAVVLGARDSACLVLAGNEPAFVVARVAVRVVRRLTKCRDRTGRAIPAQDAVVRYIAPQQAVSVVEPDGTLGPLRAAIQALNRRRRQA